MATNTREKLLSGAELLDGEREILVNMMDQFAAMYNFVDGIRAAIHSEAEDIQGLAADLQRVLIPGTPISSFVEPSLDQNSSGPVDCNDYTWPVGSDSALS